MKRDRIIIFALVGAMIFSALATGLLFLTADEAEDALLEQAIAEQSEQQDQAPVGCAVSAESQQNAGTPTGDWPATIDEKLSELVVEDIVEGTGQAVQLGDCISVHYRLSLADGTPVSGNNTFEDLGEPIAFELFTGSLIDGWVQGIPGMKEGGYRRLLVPSDLAYGSDTRPGIPGDSDLIFDVELVKIEDVPEVQPGNLEIDSAGIEAGGSE
ncbi:MAG: FKBP-type peptidyl-prolyl cis-trans isomerase [Candidatus Saccharimonadales bacterium]|nr:FKBP-type peptidyl-prolyl cis-trans isomerase [Candidatus Saccharimonadales bacterium]